ncbi:hypothetical protein ACX4MT_10750 [Roseomonas mucosa]
MIDQPRRWVGGAMVLAVASFALLGPLGGVDPLQQDLSTVLLPLGSGNHPLGTDHLGRDMLARLSHAAASRLAPPWRPPSALPALARC